MYAVATQDHSSRHVFVEQTAVIADWLPHVVQENNEAGEWWCVSSHLAEALEVIGQPVLRVGLLSWWCVICPESLEDAWLAGKGPEAMLVLLGLTSYLH